MSTKTNFVIPPATERAWAAGFFDGEGHAGAANGKYVYLSVSQTETTTLERFRLAVAGYGGIYAIATKNRPTNWAQGNYWQVGRFEEVQQVVCLLWEFLSQPKRTQITKAFESRRQYRSRWPLGFYSGQKLSDAQAREILELLKTSGLKQTEIAKQYGVSQDTISQIKLGRRKTTDERARNWHGRRRSEEYHLGLVDAVDGDS